MIMHDTVARCPNLMMLQRFRGRLAGCSLTIAFAGDSKAGESLSTTSDAEPVTPTARAR